MKTHCPPVVSTYATEFKLISRVFGFFHILKAFGRLPDNSEEGACLAVLVRRLFFGGLPEGLVGPLSESLESVYANIIKQGSLPPPVDWHPTED